VTVAALDALPAAEARETLARCCGARAWVDGMLAARPFGDRATLFTAHERVSEGLSEADWREAFAHHPRIGDRDALRRRFAATAAWAGEEQRGASGAAEETLEALAAGNRAYEEKFGYIFIVCATGRSADEMLAILRRRLDADPAGEIGTAAREQRAITRLRLEKLLSEGA
jgi:2-oxo-4-hydroxy-4-carboxy-5-ureidoimidazoline decarboxylase